MRKIIFIYCWLITLPLMAQQISIDGAYYFPTAESSGLSGVYVVHPDVKPTIRYISNSTADIRWYRFDDKGTAGKIEVLGTQSGNTSTLLVADNDRAGDYGYIVEQEGVGTITLWLATYRPIVSCSVAEVQDNPGEQVAITGEGIGIPYYTTAARKRYLPRRVAYTTAAWDDATTSIIENLPAESLATVNADDELSLPAPYGTTTFTIIDSIPTAWGASPVQISTEQYESPAIFMRATAEQKVRGALNEAAELPASGFGGSAPVEMTFTAYVNGNNYYAWEFARDAEFTTIDALYAEERLEYAFNDEGTTYVRLHAYNDYCERDTLFEIHVGESKLEAPNAFSPYGSPGVNDEWKVAYKSIVEYECWIYNRWGQKMFHSTDPTQGWNGRFNGPIVPPGVYFYVIEARGADGQKYSLKGHINILRSKNEKHQ